MVKCAASAGVLILILSAAWIDVWRRQMASNARNICFMCFSLSRSTRHSTLDTRPLSLDHLIRSVQHGLWNRQVERFRCFQIDNELKLRWLLDRQIGGLCAFENFVHVDCDTAIGLKSTRPVRHEPTVVRPLLLCMYRRNAVLCRKL